MDHKMRTICLVSFVVIFGACKSLAVETGKSRENTLDDELFPIYECDDRSRRWTQRCLVPLTNAQLSVDLCGTGEKADFAFVRQCAKDLQILAKSCPQPGPVTTLTQDILAHNPPPAPASAASYQSQNIPKAPKQRSATDKNKRDKSFL